MAKQNRKATVIGGGFAGLSEAVYLAEAGHQVDLFEKNDTVGGRARYWQSDGYRFDMGPSWYLMPEVFERFFSDVGRRREDYYELKTMDPFYKTYFTPDDTVTVGPDLNQTQRLFESFEPGAGSKLQRYLDQSRYKYDVAMDQFLYRDYRRLTDFLNLRLMVEGSRMHVFRSLDKVVRKSFSDRRARQILEYAMVFLGTSPSDAPALYSIMSHVDMNLGVFYPAGGMAGVAAAMGRLADELGVNIHTGLPVDQIEIRNGVAAGVRVNGDSYPADVVVSAADYPHTELDLLPSEQRNLGREYWEKKVFAPSMFVAYLGVSKSLPSLEHHNLYFTEHWEEHFDTVFNKPSWPQRPCFYLSCISKTDTDSAPAGSENLFLLVPVAPGLDDTDEVREQYFDHVLEHVETVVGESIRDAVDVKRIYSHRDFTRDYNAFKGTALGLAHTLGQTAIFRPPRRNKNVANLYYTGQYTHPGVGVPMTLISSSVTAQEIQKDMK